MWECVIPRVSAFLSPALASTIIAAVQAVVYNFEDIDNAPAKIYIQQSPPDGKVAWHLTIARLMAFLVTFFKLGIDQISATLFASNSAVSVEAPSGINLDTSSCATRSHNSMVGVLLPALDIVLSRRDVPHRKWRPVGRIATGLNVDVYNAPKGWQEKVSKQQEFLREQDAPTQRIWYMYREGEETSSESTSLTLADVRRPSCGRHLLTDTESDIAR